MIGAAQDQIVTRMLSQRGPLFIGDLAKEASLSVKAFRKAMDDLERKGWLKIERVSRDMVRIEPIFPEGVGHE